jgi:hypothetical protein
VPKNQVRNSTPKSSKPSNLLDNRRWIIAVIGVILVIAIVTTLVLVFNNKSADTTSSNLSSNYDTNLTLKENLYYQNITTSDVVLDFLLGQDGQPTKVLSKQVFENQDTHEIQDLLKLSAWYLQFGDKNSSQYQEFISLYNKIVLPVLDGLPLENGQTYKLDNKGAKVSSLFPPFPSINVQAQPAPCSEVEMGGDCYTTHHFEAIGLDHIFYFDTDLDHSSDLVNVLQRATRESMAKFEAAGFAQKKIYFKVQDDVFINNEGEAEPESLMSALLLEGGDYCLVDVYLSGAKLLTDGFTNEFIQSIAHELAHCVQYVNYFDQMSVDLAFSSWWVEGSAEFLSDWVYPDFDYEDRFNGFLDTVSEFRPILIMEYSNYIFFQSMYLNNGSDINIIKRFFASMPTSGTRDEQLRALSEFDRVDEIFETVLKNYLTNKHQDTSLAFKTFAPTFIETYSISRPIELPFGSYPFQYKRAKLLIQPTQFDLQARVEDLQGEGELLFWDEGQQLWTEELELETTSVDNVSCGQESRSSDYIIAIKNTMPGTTDLYEAKLIIETVDGADVGEVGNLDPQLLGTWQYTTAENADTRTKINNIFTTIFATQNIAADYQTTVDVGYICFFDNGVYTTTSKSVLIADYAGNAGGTVVTAQITSENISSGIGNWEVDNGELIYYNTKTKNDNTTRTVVPFFGIDRTIDETTNQEDPEVKFKYTISNGELKVDIGEVLDIPLYLPQVGRKIDPLFD